MQSEIRKDILKDLQLKKVCVYGVLKNLKFFEPYLIIFLMYNQLNLMEIGFLIAIREVIVNLFEIPSGFIADYFGRKKGLYFCFSFYIISFVFFFFSHDFFTAMFGMVFFGLGEAFRSGTHKAMIYTYLDYKNWQTEKTFVYGRTRSFSLIGSAISAILGIALILSVPKVSYIFLFSTLPYILDLFLIISYPNFLNASDKENTTSLKDMFTKLIRDITDSKPLRFVLLQEGITESTVSYVKDLIQPIMEIIIIGSGVLIISSVSADDNLKIILGIVYAILNLFGSYFSKKAYVLRTKRTAKECLRLFHICFAIFFGFLAFFSTQYGIVCIVYIVIYIVHSMRKPIFIDEIDNLIDKSTRATFLSVSSQIKSLLLMIIAPSLGFVADHFGIKYSMMILSFLFFLTLFLFERNTDMK